MDKHIEANAELAADLLRHMADNEIDSDYFAVVTDSPNCGREVQSEHKVTDAALMAAGIIDALLAKLEAAEKERSRLDKRNADLSSTMERWAVERAENAQEIADLLAKLEAAEKELFDLHNQEFQQRLANAEHQLYMKDLAIHNIKASRKAQFRKRKALEAENAELKERAEAAEARLLVPDELLKIGELIRTQDNRCTDQPLFAVMQQMEVVVDEDYDHDRAVWIFDGVEVNKTKSRRLEALHQGLRDTRGYDRVAVKEIDEFVTACFTRQGCENHINCNGHNLRKPFIHVFGSFRNSEYQLIRDWLSSLGNPVEGGE
ncbi:hypothetical protein AXW59_07375 [Yersinia ruckeri]|nr:hypothetical protein AXW59_07375 [Yersinia ruckeri]OJB98557.1 hypothetical protein AXW58_07355 [Yersinia ruckeri]OJC00205.1 hypothetical protein AXW57_07370 [Yersinia ruckeri]